MLHGLQHHPLQDQCSNKSRLRTNVRREKLVFFFTFFFALSAHHTHATPTSCLPPEQARESAVSLVRSDCASMSALWSSRMATVTACPALAARMRGVQPFLSLCSMLAPWVMRSSTSSSWPPAAASVSAVSWFDSVCWSTSMAGSKEPRGRAERSGAK